MSGSAEEGQTLLSEEGEGLLDRQEQVSAIVV